MTSKKAGEQSFGPIFMAFYCPIYNQYSFSQYLYFVFGSSIHSFYHHYLCACHCNGSFIYIVIHYIHCHFHQLQFMLFIQYWYHRYCLYQDIHSILVSFIFIISIVIGIDGIFIIIIDHELFLVNHSIFQQVLFALFSYIIDFIELYLPLDHS